MSSNQSLKQQHRAEFIAAFQGLIVDPVIANAKSHNMPNDAIDWIKRNLDYNVPGGKLNRGLSVVDTVRILKGNSVTEEEIRDATILGWLVELLQAFFLVSDDIMDSSITRRGQPCWYRTEGVGMIAINDAFILESCIYILLKKYFKARPYYTDLLDLFHEISWKTELGQLCDLITAPEDNVDLSKFSLEKFIVIYKTAYYSFYLPVALAMIMANVSNEKAFKDAEDILIPLGEYFQIQDDYLDCYGDPETIGKIGTDIQDNKCSWLINVALKHASAEQRQILDENYGKKDGAAEAKVKTVFVELDLESTYREYEEKSHSTISNLINNLDEKVGVKKEVFIEFMNKIYKRTK